MLGIISPAVAQVISVEFDIKPQSCPNPLNIKSRGVLPVAILGTTSFDVSDVDISSLLLGGVAPVDYSLEDVAEPDAYIEVGCDYCDTLGPDGYLDLTLKFKTQDIVAALGAVSDGDVITLTLTGTGILGEDCVIIKKKK